MPNTPSTPGKEMVFTKPNIPACWGVQPVSGVSFPSQLDVNVVNKEAVPVMVNNTEKEPVPTKEVTG